MIRSHLFQAHKQRTKCFNRIQVYNLIDRIHQGKNSYNQREETPRALKGINYLPKDWGKVSLH